MTLKQKQEQTLNALYAKVKELPLTEYEIRLVNHNAFMYSVSRKNVLQAVSFLTCIMCQHGRNLEEMQSLLEGDF